VTPLEIFKALAEGKTLIDVDGVKYKFGDTGELLATSYTGDFLPQSLFYFADSDFVQFKGKWIPTDVFQSDVTGTMQKWVQEDNPNSEDWRPIKID